MNILPYAILARFFRIPVIFVIGSRDNRNYQTSFPLPRLEPGSHTIMLQMGDLNRDVNKLRLFVDCILIGEETTEVPIRDAFMGRIVVVRLCISFTFFF